MAEFLINSVDDAAFEPCKTFGGAVTLLAAFTAIAVLSDDEDGGVGAEQAEGLIDILGIRLEAIKEHSVQDFDLLLALMGVTAAALGCATSLDLLSVSGDNDGSEEERDKAGKEHFVDFSGGVKGDWWAFCFDPKKPGIFIFPDLNALSVVHDVHKDYTFIISKVYTYYQYY